MNGDLLETRRRCPATVAWTLLFLLLLLAGFAVDGPVARWLQETGWAARADHWPGKSVLKAPGEAWFVLVVAVLASLRHPLRWQAGGFIALATALSGLHVLLKWGVGRARPYTVGPDPGQLLPFHFDWFRGGLPGFFHQTNLAFPSGHTSAAFALAAAVGILFPRGRWLFYAVATLTGLQRVSENAHFVSDIVAAAAFGVGVTYGSLWCITKIQLRVGKRSEEPAVEAAP